MKRFYLLLLLLCSMTIAGFAQTVLLSPTGDGGFETGTTFAANGWTAINSGTGQNDWAVGTGTSYAGSRGAYIGTSTSFSGSNTGSVSHFYRDIAIPAGATNVLLSFYYYQPTVDGNYDFFYFNTTTTANTPVAGIIPTAGYTTQFSNTYTAYSSYTLMGPYNLTSLAGTTVRLVFTYKNDGASPIAIPGIDNISLTYTPSTPAITASPSTLAFGGVTVGTPSSALSFSVSGVNLTGAPGNLTVTAPANYQVSYDGTVWNTTLSVPYAGTTLAATTLFARLIPVAATTYCGSNITITGGGAPTANVAVCGTGAANCTGTPTAGTASITPATGGSGTVFTLSLPSVSIAGGLTYQWRSSSTGAAGSFTDIPGATNISYSFSGLSATTYYQAVVTCPSFASSTSTNVTATFVLPASSCTPTYATPCSSFSMPASIASLTGLAGTSISDPSTGCGGTGNSYTDKTATTTVTLAQGVTYSASIGGNSFYGNFAVQIWIDFNDDGSFSTTESIGGGTTSSSATTGANIMSLMIPAGAAPGTHRMRIVGNYSGCCGGVSYPGIPPCPTTAITYGEARDYTVVIQPSCTAPGAITGNNAVCLGITNALSSTTTGGTWTSSNTSIATVSATGVVTGVSSGPATISYTVTGGCTVTRPIGVYNSATVASITPSGTTFCTGNNITFTAGSTTGTVTSYNWSGPNGYTATTTTPSTVFTPTSTASSGVYSLTVTSSAGCVSTPAKVTSAITINGSPSGFTGTNSVCQGATTILGNSVSGGTYTSGTTSLATIDPSTGVVTGVAAGLANISYTLPNTCFAATVVSVNPLPVLNVTPATSATICQGSSTSFTANSPLSTFSLLNQNFNAPLTGGWFITNGTGNVTSFFHLVSPPGIDGVVPGDGSQFLQAASEAAAGYTATRLTSPGFSTVGYGSVNLTFNEALVTVAPDDTVLVQYSIDNGTTWTPLLDQLTATAVGSGSWSAGAPEVTVFLPAAALGQSNVKLRWNYHASSYYWDIDNISVNGYLPPATYSWTGAPGLSCNTCTNPTITPTATGANLYSVTATSFAGCTTTTPVTVNVNPQPAAILGNTAICVGTSATLTSTTGGTWASSDPSKVTIGSTTGVITGIATGIANITYTLSTGCSTTTAVTVNAAPAAITGTASVCVGNTTTLSQPVSGGTWASSNTTAATISFSGVVTGAAAGNSTITYTLPSGCTVTRQVTVNALPAAITGTAAVCEGQATPLADATTGGTWSSSSPANGTVSTTGVLTGIAAGNTFVTYTLSTGCYTTTVATINATPAAITGTPAVCVGAQSALSSTTTGGTWMSTNTTNATVNASGVVTGVAAGNTSIVYTLSTGCQTATAITVNPLPAAITGANSVCQAATTTLASATTGGTWASANTTTATVSTTGVVTGVAAGNTFITYTLSTGCRRSAAITVNPLPAAISGTPVACENGGTANLSDFTASGTWSSNATYIATIDGAGTLTGAAAGNAVISYTLPTGCAATITATINPLPAPVTGPQAVCKGLNTTLSSSTTGGTWSSSNTSVAPVDASGIVTGANAGNAAISYTLATGCLRTAIVTVNALPAAIIGAGTVCENADIQLTETSTGGTWSSNAPAIADVNASGMAHGYAQGATTITYMFTATGCARTKDVTVNPAPAAITGTAGVCTGLTTTLADATTGGNWSSANATTASVSATGVVTGNSAGTTNITYTLPAGCTAITVVTVNPQPAAISGAATVCQGSTVALSNTATGGTWASDNTAIATVDAAGNVTGAAAGNTTITYTLGTGCSRTKAISVNPLPAAITGATSVCQGNTATLATTTTGGTWSSSAPATATVNSAGTVTGAAAGNASIIYTLPTGCATATAFTVNALPAAITGSGNVCAGLTTAFTDATTGGTWSTSTPAVATVNASGTVTGAAAGTAIITYTTGTGCTAAKSIVVNPAPAAITGNSSLCTGQSTTLSSASIGGTWASSNAGVASVTSAGTATAISAGYTVITYTLPTGCSNTALLSVNALPAALTGNQPVCAGSAITLTSTDGGGTWTSASMAATVDGSGTVTGVAAGTVKITYSLGTGCSRVAIVTVNALPALITGSSSLCPATTSLLNDDATGGTWSSSDAATAAVDPATGMISAMMAGNATITYTLANTCSRTKTVTVNPLPDAITGAAEVCQGAAATLASTTPSGVFTSGNTAIAAIDPATGSVTGNSAGNAMISYTLPTGCAATTMITVRPLPAAIAGTLQVCQGATTTLTNTATGGTWASSNTAAATINPATGVATGVAAGTATITYTLATGCSRTAAIAVNPLPTADTVTGGGSYCAGGAGTHIGLNGSQAATAYSLYNGASLVATMAGAGSAIDFGTFTTAGTYSVTAATTLGCSSNMSGTATVTITPLVFVDVAVSAIPGDTLCRGTAASFTATPTNGGTTPTYTWSVNGAAATATAATFTYTPANGDVVTATLASSIACPSLATVSASRHITVVDTLTPSVSITANPGNKVCQGSTVTFTATAANGGTAPVYTWITAGSIATATGSSFTYTPANGDIVTAKLLSNYRCPVTNNVSSNNIAITVDSIYVPVVSIIANPGTVISANQSVTFTTVVSHAGPAPAYQWMINGVPVTGATLPTFTGSRFSNGDSVTCVVTGSGACGLPTINSVSLRVDGSVGVQHTAAASNIALVPNPNSGTFTVAGTLGTASEEAAIEVTDVLGQVVYHSKVTATNGAISERIQLGSNIANGMYLLTVHTADAHTTFHFVVKQ